MKWLPCVRWNCRNASTSTVVPTSTKSKMWLNLDQAPPLLPISACRCDQLTPHASWTSLWPTPCTCWPLRWLPPPLQPPSWQRSQASVEDTNVALEDRTSPLCPRSKTSGLWDPAAVEELCSNERSARTLPALHLSAANRGILARWRQSTSVALQVGNAHIQCEAVTASSLVPDVELARCTSRQRKRQQSARRLSCFSHGGAVRSFFMSHEKERGRAPKAIPVSNFCASWFASIYAKRRNRERDPHNLIKTAQLERTE